MQPEGRRILLTGATGGIGFELARELVRRGARVVAAGRNAEALERLARDPETTAVHADIATTAGRLAVTSAVAATGGVDAVIHAAGVNRFGMLEAMDDAAIEGMIAINVTAPIALTRSLLPGLRRREQSAVVFVGSILGSLGHPGFAAYCATKGALHAFSEALRRELADTGVRVLYVAPRATRTAMNTSRVEALNRELGVAMDDPAKVAGLVCDALAGDRSESYLGWPEKIFVRLNALLPGLVDGAMRKQLAVVKRFAASGG